MTQIPVKMRPWNHQLRNTKSLIKRYVYFWGDLLDAPGGPAGELCTNRGEELAGGGLLEVRVDGGGKGPGGGGEEEVAREVEEPAAGVPDEELRRDRCSNLLERPVNTVVSVANV